MTSKVAGRRIIHSELPIIPSPSGLPSQHIVTKAVGSQNMFLGQQWLQPGDRVLRHSHPVDEAVMFLAGSGEAVMGEETVTFEAGTSLFFPAGLVHGFRNTGSEELHVIIVFPTPTFAATTIVEPICAKGEGR